VIDRLAFGLCLALLFVWSLPGTIALRLVLLAGALALLARRLAAADFRAGIRSAALPLGLLAALTLWLLLQAEFISNETHWTLGELRGQWLPALLALVLGLLLATRADATRLVTAVTLVFAAQAAIAVGQSLLHWHFHREIFTGLVPLTGGKLEMSFVLNILLAILTVDLFCRATGRAALLRLPLAAVVAILLLALTSSLLAGARNGVIGIAFLSLSALSLLIFDQRHRLGPLRTFAAASAIILGIATLGAASYRTDPRWQSFVETVPIAWNIDQYDSWFDGDMWGRPVLGECRHLEHGDWRCHRAGCRRILPECRYVEPSAYLRIAFIRAGLRLIGEHPLGYGYGRNAFAHALRLNYPKAQLGHAHSGWIDLGLGGGVPALALWAALIGSLMWRGWRSFFDAANPGGLLLFFLATGYAGRMALDSVNKDHMLQMFMFLAGLLLVLTAPRRTEGGP
jgi:O-Antigen ligase